MFFSVASHGQIEVDKRIELTGSGTDAKITGIKHVSDDEDAVNKKYVDSLVTANSGGGVDLDFTFTASANSVSGGSSNNNTPAITLTATAFAGTITPINVVVTGMPSGVSYTLTPSAGYPVPSLNMLNDPSTLDWQPIVKVEHYRLKQDSVKHPVELKEDAPPYRTNAD